MFDLTSERAFDTLTYPERTYVRVALNSYGADWRWDLAPTETGPASRPLAAEGVCEHEPGPAMGTGTGHEEQRGASAMTISASIPLRVVVLLTSVALALALLLTGAVVARANDGSVTGGESGGTVTAHIEHVVVVGDTLWDIAAAYTAPADDVRETIFDIKAANALDSSVIVTGQTLVIPLEF